MVFGASKVYIARRPTDMLSVCSFLVWDFFSLQNNIKLKQIYRMRYCVHTKLSLAAKHNSAPQKVHNIFGGTNIAADLTRHCILDNSYDFFFVQAWYSLVCVYFTAETRFVKFEFSIFSGDVRLRLYWNWLEYVYGAYECTYIYRSEKNWLVVPSPLKIEIQKFHREPMAVSANYYSIAQATSP